QIGFGTRDQALAVWRYVGLAAAAVICVFMIRRHRARPVLGVGLGLAALVFLAPVFHPWYMLWATVPLGAAATTPRTRKVVTGLVVVMSVLVFPGGIPAETPAVLGVVLGAVVALVTAWALNLDRTD